MKKTVLRNMSLALGMLMVSSAALAGGGQIGSAGGLNERIIYSKVYPVKYNGQIENYESTINISKNQHNQVVVSVEHSWNMASAASVYGILVQSKNNVLTFKEIDPQDVQADVATLIAPMEGGCEFSLKFSKDQQKAEVLPGSCGNWIVFSGTKR